MGSDLSKSLEDYFADLTDVTLADEDGNSTPADDVNRAILGNVAIQVAPPGDQLWNYYNWCHLADTFVTLVH